MFNLNTPSSSFLSVDSGGLCTTPKTPEIVNTLIAMTNPLDNYNFTPHLNSGTNQNGNSANYQFISQDSSNSSCSGSPLDSPAGSNPTPSVQQTCSQLIKAGLKLSIQSKRKLSTGDSSSGSEQPSSKYSRKCEDNMMSSDDDCDSFKSPRGLTAEDEDRRRRRRERNKIAATKCRMKKRERTLNLIKESEQLDTQNVDLKTQMRNLEKERLRLFEMLQGHSSICVRSGGFSLPANLCQSPAFKYLNELDIDNSLQKQQQTDQMIDQNTKNSQRRTVIPPMSTIKYSRNNGYKQSQQQQQHQQQLCHQTEQQQINSNQHQQQHQHQQHIQQQSNNLDLLPNGYCKPSPTPQELGYLNSPSQDVSLCLPSMNQHQSQQQNSHHHHLSSNHQVLKSDYIPNCENSNGGSGSGINGGLSIDNNTNDFALKNELVDSQSPYTTAQSAERFLFESNCENYDIKHNDVTAAGIIANNNNTTNHNNNHSIVDFNHQLNVTIPINNCQSSYDIIKNDFLPSHSELLAQFAADDVGESEFTDLDTGVAAFVQMTNGGCIA